mmetsp:Transcript_60937/g.108252  ORF Transcript_60937/g.108252 Transcript_60937/m.108252 type:complete len:663 (-) Transcript_60937:22-2010(-)
MPRRSSQKCRWGQLRAITIFFATLAALAVLFEVRGLGDFESKPGDWESASYGVHSSAAAAAAAAAAYAGDSVAELDRRLSRHGENESKLTRNSSLDFEGKPPYEGKPRSTSPETTAELPQLETPAPRPVKSRLPDRLSEAWTDEAFIFPREAIEPSSPPTEPPPSAPSPPFTGPPRLESPGIAEGHFIRHEHRIKNVIILGPFDAGNHYFDSLWRKNFNSTMLLKEDKKIWPHSLQTGKEKSIQDLVNNQTGNLSSAALLIVIRNPISMITSWIKAPYDLVHCVKRPLSRWDAACPACLCPALSWEQQNRACTQQRSPISGALPRTRKPTTKRTTSTKAVRSTAQPTTAQPVTYADSARRLVEEDDVKDDEEEDETTTRRAPTTRAPTRTTRKRISVTRPPRPTAKPPAKPKKRGPPCTANQFSNTADVYNSYMRQYQSLLADKRIGVVRLVPYEDLVRMPAKMLSELSQLVGLEKIGEVVLIEKAAKSHGKASGHSAALERLESRAWLKNISATNRKALCQRLDFNALRGLKETAEDKSLTYMHDCTTIDITEANQQTDRISWANEPSPVAIRRPTSARRTVPTRRPKPATVGTTLPATQDQARPELDAAGEFQEDPNGASMRAMTGTEFSSRDIARKNAVQASRARVVAQASVRRRRVPR